MIFRYIFFVILGITLSGCNNAPQGFPQVVPCTITVVKDGVPLPEVTVMLVANGGNEWFTAAESNKSGVAEIQTFQRDYTLKGAPVGTFKVTLSQRSQVKSEFTQQQLFDMSPAEKNTVQARRDKLMAESRSFPVEFESAATTPISVEVVKPKTDIRLDVTEWIGKR